MHRDVKPHNVMIDHANRKVFIIYKFFNISIIVLSNKKYIAIIRK